MPRRLASSKRLSLLLDRKPKRPKGDKPKYATGTKDLCAFWNERWFPVDIVKVNHQKNEEGEWLYEIRWKDYENTAEEGEEPTNESTYPEAWIWHVSDLPRYMRMSKADGKKEEATGETKADPSTAALTHQWQCQEIKKTKEPWRDLDGSFAQVLEECCQAWLASPQVDCLERTITGHRYAVDFQQLRLIALEHGTAVPPRRIRRVTADGSLATDSVVTVAKRVMAERQQSQKAQLGRTGCRILAHRLTEPPQRESESWVPVEDIAQLRPGMSVRVQRAPVSGYQYEHPEYFGQTGTVCALQGYPPVYLKLEGHDPYWFDYQDLEVPVQA